MKLEEIEQINRTTKGRDIASAARAFLGLPDNEDNIAAAVNGIVDEVMQWNEADQKTRAGIEAYKAAKDPAVSADRGKQPKARRSAGKTQAKSK